MIDINGGSTADKMLASLRDTFTPDGKADPYIPTINSAADNYGIPATVLYKLLYKESRFRPDIISGETKSPAGALGIAQFMPATAAQYRIDPLDWSQAINGAARYLSDLRGSLGDLTSAVAAYNWGIGNVKRKGLHNAPSETRDYVSFIMGVDI